MSRIMAVIDTNKGKINLNLFAEQVPVTVTNFVNLAGRGYYKGITFHRVIEDFMIQAGCPYGIGSGGPGYTFEDEIVSELKHSKAGVLSMANAGPGTNGSQFFITHVATPWLDGNHTVFGEVISSKDQDVVDSIEQDDIINDISIEGDVESLLTAQSDRIAEWNAILAKEE